MTPSATPAAFNRSASECASGSRRNAASRASTLSSPTASLSGAGGAGEQVVDYLPGPDRGCGGQPAGRAPDVRTIHHDGRSASDAACPSLSRSCEDSPGESVTPDLDIAREFACSTN